MASPLALWCRPSTRKANWPSGPLRLSASERRVALKHPASTWSHHRVPPPPCSHPIHVAPHPPRSCRDLRATMVCVRGLERGAAAAQPAARHFLDRNQRREERIRAQLVVRIYCLSSLLVLPSSSPPLCSSLIPLILARSGSSPRWRCALRTAAATATTAPSLSCRCDDRHTHDTVRRASKGGGTRWEGRRRCACMARVCMRHPAVTGRHRARSWARVDHSAEPSLTHSLLLCAATNARVFVASLPPPPPPLARFVLVLVVGVGRRMCRARASSLRLRPPQSVSSLLVRHVFRVRS